MAKILNQTFYTFDDVLLRPLYSEVKSRKDVDTSIELVPGLKLETPIIAANMDAVISVELCVELSRLGGIATIHQFMDIDSQVSMVKEVKSKGAKVAGAIGTSQNYMERAEVMINNGVDLIVMDTPHGHSKNMIDAVINFKSKFGNFPIIAGNIATKQAAIDVIDAGADGVKVGVGPGSACLTRVNTGSGAAQLSAIMECAEVTKAKGKALIADGGIKKPGDFAKAIAAGGDIVMIGTLLGGTDEAPGEVIHEHGKMYKYFHGSASARAREERKNKDSNYESKPTDFIEGGEGLVEYQGNLESLVDRFIMGLRSAMSYSGAFTINEFYQKAEFTPITMNGVKENGAHGLV